MRLELSANGGRILHVKQEEKSCAFCKETNTDDWYFYDGNKLLYCRDCVKLLPDCEVRRGASFWRIDKFEVQNETN